MHYKRFIKKDYKDDLVDPSVPRYRTGGANVSLPLSLGLALLVGIGLYTSGQFSNAASEPVAATEPAPVAAPAPVAVAPKLAENYRTLNVHPPAARTLATTRPVVVPEAVTTSSPVPPPAAPVVAKTTPEPAPEPVTTPAAAPAGYAPDTTVATIADKSRDEQRQVMTVKRGDTLSAVFERAGVPAKHLYNLLADKSLKRQLRKLMPGQTITLATADDGSVESLDWQIDELNSLRVYRKDGRYQSESITRVYDVREATAKGSISSSLFLAGQAAGLSDGLIMEMVAILGWDIDFALDIRQGDRFSVVYEELYDEEGNKVRNGKILAAAFNNRGREVRALRYTDPSGHTDYYSPDGHSMRKAFIRTPVDFARISSRFNLKRKHPVLNRIRAHKGVDYAARTGTPIKATGDGKVIFRGRKGGYGRTVIIQHGGKYSTLYAHMSRFNRNAKQGSRVRQGQIIGYVGASGLATGPHLHYEFRVNGVHRNPLTVKLPKALPLASKYLADFKAKSAGLIARLDAIERTQLALAE